MFVAIDLFVKLEMMWLQKTSNCGAERSFTPLTEMGRFTWYCTVYPRKILDLPSAIYAEREASMTY